QVGVLGLFVGVVDPGEVADLAAHHLLVQALVVAGRADLDRRPAPDLDEGLDLLARTLPVLSVGRDRGDDDRYAVARQKLAHERDTPDVLGPVGAAEAEVSAKSLAHDVAVQDLDTVDPERA